MKIAVYDILNDSRTELDENAHVEFGEGLTRITVSVRDNEIHISADGRLMVMPRAANLVFVKSVWK